MGKKGKKKVAEEKKSSKIWLFLIAGVLIVGIAFIVGGKSNNDVVSGKKNSFTVQGGETRPVLDPSQFTGMVRAAYAAAKAYPQVLDQVYCYCYCDDPPFNHKSLLSCFVETHGAG
ncbi:MAG: hypothetical protein D6726_08405 [Nitrospirae bacterium]|nr:MAG: hypothetical protein D6726_08405 [Nitrospirota bacterium]